MGRKSLRPYVIRGVNASTAGARQVTIPAFDHEFGYRAACAGSAHAPVSRCALPGRSVPAMRAFEQRQLIARVLAALESRVKQFRRREELWPIRIPVEPIALDDVIEEALGDDSRRFDAGTLRSRTLLQLEWGTEARWDAWVIALPSKTKLYCDSDGEETRLLASGGRNEGDENDRVFLQTLAETGGQAFGIETSGDAPTRVRSSITDRAFLVEFFVNLFEVTGTEASVRAAIQAASRPSGDDFQREVEVWLATALKP